MKKQFAKGTNKMNAFEVERWRDMLVRKRQYPSLIKTYLPEYSEITDINSSKFWNKAFIGGKKNYGSMHVDKRKFTINRLKNFKGKLLSIGFGTGQLEEKLSRQSTKIYGVDISKYVVERAKKRIKGTFKRASILKIPFKSNTFNCVLALEVMEHIVPSKTFKALTEVKRVLKDSGILVLSVPLNEPLEEMIKKGQNLSGHVRVYTAELIKVELKIAGFKVKGEKYLYAFETMYFLKKLLQKTILKNRWKPNNIIIFAEKDKKV